MLANDAESVLPRRRACVTTKLSAKIMVNKLPKNNPYDNILGTSPQKL
jgi:hypothetical protein